MGDSFPRIPKELTSNWRSNSLAIRNWGTLSCHFSFGSTKLQVLIFSKKDSACSLLHLWSPILGWSTSFSQSFFVGQVMHIDWPNECAAPIGPLWSIGTSLEQKALHVIFANEPCRPWFMTSFLSQSCHSQSESSSRTGLGLDGLRAQGHFKLRDISYIYIHT